MDFALEALQTLVNVMRTSDNDATRVSAAGKILEESAGGPHCSARSLRLLAGDHRRSGLSTQTEIEHDGKRFIVRSAPRPAASLAIRVAGVALPPTVREATAG